MRQLRQLIFEVLAEADKPKWNALENDSFDMGLDSYFIDAEASVSEAADDEGEDVEKDEKSDDANTPAAELNMPHFAAEVARLAENFSNLFDIEGTVVRRAINFVGSKYGKEQAKLLEDVLSTQFDLQSNSDQEELEVPGADRAGPSLAG